MMIRDYMLSEAASYKKKVRDTKRHANNEGIVNKAARNGLIKSRKILKSFKRFKRGAAANFVDMED